MIRKSILLLSLSTGIFAMDSAKLPVGNIKSLNTDYQSPRGDGDAQVINLEDFGQYTNAKLEVENYNGLLMFSIEDKTFELDISMFGIKDADQIRLSNLNFTNSKSKISLSMSTLSANDPKFSTSLTNGSINCNRKVKYEDIKDDLLSACITSGSINISNIKFKSTSSEFINIVDNSILGTNMNIDKMWFNFRGSNFKGEIKGDITKNTTVKLDGRSWYNPDTNVLKIKLDKAKAGIFNVKKTIFKALKKAQSDTLRVEKPYVYMTFKD